MKVPLLDLKLQYLSLKGDIDAAIARVCDTQHFILGPAVKELETAVANYSGAAHAIGVSSGTDALLLAMMALDIGPSDEVLTSSFTFFATGGTIARTGALPIFLDIEPDTFNLSPRAVREYLEAHCNRRAGKLLDSRTGRVVRALMPVHLYGQLADMSELLSIAREYGLRVIEDAAQAIGAEDSKGQRAGSLGDVGCLSFFPTKNLGAFGDAGLCLSQDGHLAHRMRILRVHGAEPKYYHTMIGGNFRLDELQAAVLNIKLTHLDDWTAGRQRNARIYREAFLRTGLSQVVGLPAEVVGARHVYNQFVIRVPRRDELRVFLATHEIGTEIYYPVPLHLQQCFAYLRQSEGELPESERAARHTLALPIYPELSANQLEYVVEKIAEFYA